MRLTQTLRTFLTRGRRQTAPVVLPDWAFEGGDGLPLVEALMEYRRSVMGSGCFKTTEIDPILHRVFLVLDYVRIVEDGGHQGFLSRPMPEGADWRATLRALEDMEFLELASCLLSAADHWHASDDCREADDFDAPPFEILMADDRFADADHEEDFLARLREAVINIPDLEICNQDSWKRALRRIAGSHPDRTARRAGSACVRIQEDLENGFLLGLRRAGLFVRPEVRVDTVIEAKGVPCLGPEVMSWRLRSSRGHLGALRIGDHVLLLPEPMNGNDGDHVEDLTQRSIGRCDLAFMESAERSARAFRPAVALWAILAVSGRQEHLTWGCISDVSESGLTALFDTERGDRLTLRLSDQGGEVHSRLQGGTIATLRSGRLKTEMERVTLTSG